MKLNCVVWRQWIVATMSLALCACEQQENGEDFLLHSGYALSSAEETNGCTLYTVTIQLHLNAALSVMALERTGYSLINMHA